MTDDTHQDENKYIAQRRDKLTALRAHGNAYPNHFQTKTFRSGPSG